MSLGRSEESTLRFAHGKMDVSNAGRGRRVRKPSDKALAAAQANLEDSSSDDGSSSESRLVRVAMTRNKARKRRSESVSSGNDIDSDERRSADSPAAPPLRGHAANDKTRTPSMHGYHEASSALEQKPVAERSSALLGAEALMGLAALASSVGAAAPAPVPSIAPPPPAAPSAANAQSASATRQRITPKSAAPPPAAAARSKPRKESWPANAPATAATPATVPTNKRIAAEGKAGRGSVAPKAIAPAGSQPEQRTWKRCATHVAIAYYIFYRQRHHLLQQLTVTNPPLAQKMAPYAMDPTYDARVLKERSMEFAKRKQQMMNPHLQYILNSPVKQQTSDPRAFGSYTAGGFHNSGAILPHQQMPMAQLAMMHAGGPGVMGVGGAALPANFHYFGPPPTGSALPQPLPPPPLLAASAAAPPSGKVVNGTTDAPADKRPGIKEENKDTCQSNSAALPSVAQQATAEATADRAST